MMQIITEEAVILFDPIETIFDVTPVGGSLVQRLNTVTGEYSPDRTIVPMVISPSLQVVDHNITDGSKASDVTALLAVNWYIVTTENGTEQETEIVAVYDAEAVSHADYELYGKGLMVNANVPTGSGVHLRFKARYVNSNTSEPLQFKRDFQLETTSYVEFNPSIELNLPNYTIVNPLQLTAANRNLAVTAKFFAGALDISANSRVTFLWEKLEGTTYRAITATDVEVVSISRNVMTINQDCVGRCKYRVTAWHQDYSAAENRRQCLLTLDRKLNAIPGMRIIRGKFLKSNIQETEAELFVTVNSHEISNPLDFFRAKWAVYKQHGTTSENRVELGWNKTVVVDRTVTGKDRSRVPTLELKAYTLSEYRLLYDENDEPVTDENGENVVGQVIEDL